MRKPFFIFCLILAVAAPPPAAPESPASAAEKQVLVAEQSRVAALCRSDLPALQRLLADDLTYVHASGKVDTKSSFLAAIRSGQLHYISWQPGNLHVRVLGETALIDGEYAVRVLDSRMQHDPFNVSIFILTAYARRDGRWQQIAWQSTRDPAKSPAN
ncbi:MAG: nuclear transport factor 2 family protein [Terracidiphilus sp.]